MPCNSIVINIFAKSVNHHGHIIPFINIAQLGQYFCRCEKRSIHSGCSAVLHQTANKIYAHLRRELLAIVHGYSYCDADATVQKSKVHLKKFFGNVIPFDLNNLLGTAILGNSSVVVVSYLL